MPIFLNGLLKNLRASQGSDAVPFILYTRSFRANRSISLCCSRTANEISTPPLRGDMGKILWGALYRHICRQHCPTIVGLFCYIISGGSGVDSGNIYVSVQPKDVNEHGKLH